MNYREKYLKYKTKYLKLKSIIGGSTLYPVLYKDIKNEILWGEDEDILTNKDDTIKKDLWDHEQYKSDSSILVSHAYAILVKKYKISEEEFYIRLGKTRLKEKVLERIKKSVDGENKTEDKIIEDDILAKYIPKVANDEILTAIQYEIGIQRPFKIDKIRKFLKDKGFSLTNIIEDINCLEKNRDECRGNCRWQPIDNESRGEIGGTCYRINYDIIPLKRKKKEKEELLKKILQEKVTEAKRGI